MAPMNSVLAPGSIEMPTCMCGEEMQLTKVEPHPAAEDAELLRLRSLRPRNARDGLDRILISVRFRHSTQA